MGLPLDLARQRRFRLEDLRAVERDDRRLLRAGHQQAGAAPSLGATVGGVPLLRRGPEPVAERRRATGAPSSHGQGRHPRQGRGFCAPACHGHAPVPNPGPADRRRSLRRRTLVGSRFLTAAGSTAIAAAGRPIAGSRRLSLSWVGLVPFFIYTGLFLFLPTLIIVVGSLTTKDGAFTTANFSGIAQSYLVKAFGASIVISAASAAVGAIGGALLA